MKQGVKKKLKIATIVLGILTVGLIITLLVLMNRDRGTSITDGANDKIRDILGQGVEKADIRSVVSKLGFTVRYDAKTFGASAHEPTAKSDDKTYNVNTYKDDELKTSRSYNLIELGFQKKLSDMPKVEGVPSQTAVRPYLSINTSRAKNYFDRTKLPEKYKDAKKYSDLDMMAVVAQQQLQDAEPNATYKITDMTISGRKFKRLDHTRKSSFGGQETVTGHAYTYMTVQNNRPYWMRVTVYSSVSRDDIAAIESLIAHVSFQKPDESALIGAADPDSGRSITARLVESSGESKLDDDELTNTPGIVSSSSLIKVIARNQLATVRVGTFRCADIKYTAANGASMYLDGLCSGGIGSGSIISSDGYVATNGHVTEVSDTKLSRGMRNRAQADAYAKFMVEAGYISRREMDSLLQKALDDDAEATAAFYALVERVPSSGIQVSNDRESYIIQTSNDPIRYSQDASTGRVVWSFNNTNLQARKIDAEVDPGSDVHPLSSTYTDVAILKLDGQFPAVELGDMDRLKSGDEITAMGFPAIVDDGTETTKKTTVPTATQGEFEKTQTDAAGHKLFWMSTEIAQGNSGGPAFNADGLQVGINTYSTSTDGDSFGQGIARDIKDLRDIARKNNISITSSSLGELTQLWKSGLEKFSRGQYSAAKGDFEKLNQKYPNNYLVSRILDVAKNTPDNYIKKPAPDRQTDTTSDDGGGYYYDPGYNLSSQDAKAAGVAVIVIIIISLIVGTLFIVGLILLIVYASKKPANRPPQPPYPPHQPPPYNPPSWPVQ